MLKNIVAFIIIAIVCTSCGKEFLNLDPKGTQLESNYYKNQDEAFEALVAAYDVIQWGGMGGWTMLNGLHDSASDDCYAGGSDASDQPTWVAMDNFSIHSELGPQEGLWTKYYSGIYRCNLFLQKIEDIEEETLGFKARTIAEAKFLRAYYYFDLVRLFGNVPLLVEVVGQETFFSITQSSPAEVYAQIELDLNDAINAIELPDVVLPDELGRVTRGACQALLGKAILFQNNESRMGEAADAFRDIINSGTYYLSTDFPGIFSLDGEFGSGSIFEIQHSANSRMGWGGFATLSEGNYQTQFIGIRDYEGPDYSSGWGFNPITEDLESFMQGDPRYQHTIINGNDLIAQGATYSPGYQNTDFFCKKYAPLQANFATEGDPPLNWNNNYRAIRYADVLLMAAEAIVRAGQGTGEAESYLNQVRNRVGLPNFMGGDLLEAIYRERRMEFATEGLRFWDLVRTGKAEEVLGASGFTANKNELLPIPQPEIDKTSFFQNPGY